MQGTPSHDSSEITTPRPVHNLSLSGFQQDNGIGMCCCVLVWVPFPPLPSLRYVVLLLVVLFSNLIPAWGWAGTRILTLRSNAPGSKGSLQALGGRPPQAQKAPRRVSLPLPKQPPPVTALL